MVLRAGNPRELWPGLSHSWLQLALLQCRSSPGPRWTVFVLPGLPSSLAFLAWPSSWIHGRRRGENRKVGAPESSVGSRGWRGREEGSHSGFHPTSPGVQAAAGPGAQARGPTPLALCALGVDSGGEGGMGRFRGLGLGAGGQRPLDEQRGSSEPGTWSNLKSWLSPQADGLVGTSGEPPLHIPPHPGAAGWGEGLCHRARGQLRMAGGAGGGSGRGLSTLTSVAST